MLSLSRRKPSSPDKTYVNRSQAVRRAVQSFGREYETRGREKRRRIHHQDTSPSESYDEEHHELFEHKDDYDDAENYCDDCSPIRKSGKSGREIDQATSPASQQPVSKTGFVTKINLFCNCGSGFEDKEGLETHLHDVYKLKSPICSGCGRNVPRTEANRDPVCEHFPTETYAQGNESSNGSFSRCCVTSRARSDLNFIFSQLESTPTPSTDMNKIEICVAGNLRQSGVHHNDVPRLVGERRTAETYARAYNCQYVGCMDCNGVYQAEHLEKHYRTHCSGPLERWQCIICGRTFPAHMLGSHACMGSLQTLDFRDVKKVNDFFAMQVSQLRKRDYHHLRITWRRVLMSIVRQVRWEYTLKMYTKLLSEYEDECIAVINWMINPKVYQEAFDLDIHHFLDTSLFMAPAEALQGSGQIYHLITAQVLRVAGLAQAFNRNLKSRQAAVNAHVVSRTKVMAGSFAMYRAYRTGAHFSLDFLTAEIPELDCYLQDEFETRGIVPLPDSRPEPPPPASPISIQSSDDAKEDLKPASGDHDIPTFLSSRLALAKGHLQDMEQIRQKLVTDPDAARVVAGLHRSKLSVILELEAKHKQLVQICGQAVQVFKDNNEQS